MRTGRIAEMLEKIGAHGLGNFRINWGGGVIVQVNGLQCLTLQFLGSRVSGSKVSGVRFQVSGKSVEA